jgi:hypothetical protein
MHALLNKLNAAVEAFETTRVTDGSPSALETPVN